MTRFFNPLFATEIVECIAENRAPTTLEVISVAERIRREAGEQSAFAREEASSEESLFLWRAAHLALCGSDIARCEPASRALPGRTAISATAQVAHKLAPGHNDCA